MSDIEDTVDKHKIPIAIGIVLVGIIAYFYIKNKNSSSSTTTSATSNSSSNNVNQQLQNIIATQQKQDLYLAAISQQDDALSLQDVSEYDAIANKVGANQGSTSQLWSMSPVAYPGWLGGTISEANKTSKFSTAPPSDNSTRTTTSAGGQVGGDLASLGY